MQTSEPASDQPQHVQVQMQLTWSEMSLNSSSVYTNSSNEHFDTLHLVSHQSKLELLRFTMQINVQTYPPPPAFFRLYREDAEGSAERPLPPAPPAPVEGEFQMFGEMHTARTLRCLALAALAPPAASVLGAACSSKQLYFTTSFSACMPPRRRLRY